MERKAGFQGREAVGRLQPWPPVTDTLEFQSNHKIGTVVMSKLN